MTELIVTLVTINGLALVALGSVVAMRAADRVSTDSHYQLLFPRSLKLEQIEAFLVGLRAALPQSIPWRRRPCIVLEVRSHADQISFELHLARRFTKLVLGQLQAAIPDARVIELASNKQPRIDVASELRIAPSVGALGTDHPVPSSTSILTSVGQGAGSTSIVQWLIAPARMAASATGPRWTDWCEALAGRSGSATVDRQVKTKLAGPQFVAVLRVGVRSEERGLRADRLQQLVGSFRVVSTPTAHVARRRLPAGRVTKRLATRSVPILSWPNLLSTKDLGTLLAWPLDGPPLHGLTYATSRQLPPAKDIATEGRVLAYSNVAGLFKRPLAVSLIDSMKGIYVLGPTGGGKSTALLNQITYELGQGRGVLVIDAKGDLVRDLIDRIPAGREHEVVLIDPSDAGYPVPINPLATVNGQPEVVVDQLVTTLRRLYEHSWGPRLEDILRSVSLTLATAKQPMSIVELPLALTDANFRRWLVGQLRDPVGLEPFWQAFESWSANEKAQAIAPVTNKLRALLTRKSLRNIVGQVRPTFTFEKVMAEGGIVLVSLAPGIIGEDAAILLGSTVVGLGWQAARARMALPPDQRPPFMAFIDEFAQIVNLPTNLGDALAQARGLSLSLTLSHQHTDQLPVDIREAVLANARTKQVFALSASDARRMAREFSPSLTPGDLQGLGSYEVMVAVSTGGAVSPPASGVTAPPPPATGSAEIVRRLSRQQFARPRLEVEANMWARHAKRPVDERVQRRRRS